MIRNKFKYIVIEGNIGAGKTSLARKINESEGGTLILEEFAENTFLKQFYNDPDQFAFPLELSFLAARYKQLSELSEQNPDDFIISDYHLFKSSLFAGINLPNAEYELYKSFYEIIKQRLPEPDLVIFLKKDVKQLQHNISRRGRDFEKNIEGSYLQSINDAYEDFLNHHFKGKLLPIESNNMDFVNNPDHFQEIINMIKKS